MAVKIRLTRLGKKKQPTYRVVVMDSRKPRDGKYIEQLGIYDPRQEPSLIEIDNERALHWLNTGAQPTERAQKLLEISGAWTQFKVSKGEIHTVGDDDKAAEPKAEAKVEHEPEIHVVGDEPDDEEVEDAAPADVEASDDASAGEADEDADEAADDKDEA